MSTKWRPVAEVALLVETAKPLAVFQRLHALNDPRIRGLHPTYTSVLIDFDPLRTDAVELQTALAPIVDAAETDTAPEGRLVTIPVHYGGEEGPDLEAVAQHHGLSTSEIVRLHSSVEYLVAFLGFQPGFPYLRGLPRELATPRLETPRLRVPAGSVGIAGDQTGIYPIASPGGWHLIGRARVDLFQPHREPPTLLLPGDRVRFVPEGV